MMTVASTLLLSAYKKNYRIIVLDYNGTFRINRLLEIIKARSKCNISVSLMHLFNNFPRLKFRRTWKRNFWRELQLIRLFTTPVSSRIP